MLHWFLTIIATPISASYCRKTMYYGCTESRESDIVEIGNWYTAPILLVLLIPFLIGILLHHAFLLVYIRWIKAFLHERCCSHYLKWRRDWCKYYNISICDYNDIEIFIRNSGCATPLLLWYVGSQTGTWKLALTSHILVSCYSFLSLWSCSRLQRIAADWCIVFRLLLLRSK